MGGGGSHSPSFSPSCIDSQWVFSHSVIFFPTNLVHFSHKNWEDFGEMKSVKNAPI